MRGSRVKNIVSELQGEKIDIVRFSSDIREYIQAALSPAEILQIQLNPDEKKANIIVADDQLSLAIGKKGQNVRLGSELVGWNLNIFTAAQWEEKKEQAKEEEDDELLADSNKEKKTKVQAQVLGKLTAVGDKIKVSLLEYDFDSIEKIAAATPAGLTQIKGLGKIKAEKLIEEAKLLLG